MDRELKGVMPAAASPCDERDVFLEDKFAQLVTHLYSQGVNGLYVCGGTGDGYNMRLGERKRAAEIAVELSRKSGGRVIVHVGTSNTRDTVELAEHAAETGVNAIASIPPINRSQAQHVDYYRDVARAAGIPVFVYHIPVVTNRVPTLDEMLELLDIEGVIGLKLTDWNMFFLKRLLIERPDITAFNGWDEMFCPALLYGAHGGIGTWFNLFPKLYLGIYEAVTMGNIAHAMDLQNLLLAFSNVAWKHGAFPVFELLMNERGLAPHCFRRPRIMFEGPVRERILCEVRPTIEAIEKATMA